MKKQLFSCLAIGLLLNLLGAASSLAADRINITSPPYNAIPNDGISDKPAIDAAIAAGRSIYFPPGTYNYPGLMSLPANQSYRLYGDGPGVSNIVFTGTDAGIYAASMGTKSLNVEGLTLQANTTMQLPLPGCMCVKLLPARRTKRAFERKIPFSLATVPGLTP